MLRINVENQRVAAFFQAFSFQEFIHESLHESCYSYNSNIEPHLKLISMVPDLEPRLDQLTRPTFV